MVEHRRWKSLFPIVPLQECSKYDELIVRIFEGNPSISGKVLHDFLLSAYGHNVSIVELDQWLDYVRFECSLHLPHDLLLGCYNVKVGMGPEYFCELLAKSGVESSVFAMQCWLALRLPLPIVSLKDFVYLSAVGKLVIMKIS